MDYQWDASSQSRVLWSGVEFNDATGPHVTTGQPINVNRTMPNMTTDKEPGAAMLEGEGREDDAIAQRFYLI